MTFVTTGTKRAENIGSEFMQGIGHLYSHLGWMSLLNVQRQNVRARLLLPPFRLLLQSVLFAQPLATKDMTNVTLDSDNPGPSNKICTTSGTKNCTRKT